MKNYLFELKEGLIISLRAIFSNKIRSVLTTLGIVIGVSAVVLMSSAVQGIDKSFQDGVSSMGSDNLYIDKWQWFSNDVPWWEMRNRKNLQVEDFEKYKKLAKLPIAVAPTVWVNYSVEYEDKTAQYIVITGTNADYIATTNMEFSDGRFFTELESNSSRNVVVVGYEIAKRIFPYDNGLGKEVKIKGKKFKVVGILDKQGSEMMGDFNPDNQVFVPIGCIYKYYLRESERSITINVRAPNSTMVDEVTEEAYGIMRKVRGLAYNEVNDFSINRQDGILSQINETVGVIQIAGFAITGLSLFVGAIGIMNIMFVSVKERTKEIGVRKAIGAKKRTILTQFIAEASIICLLGGLIGLGIAVVGTLMIQQNTEFPIVFQYNAVLLAVSISLLTGVLSGFAPAFVASNMDPVDALRYE